MVIILYRTREKGNSQPGLSPVVMSKNALGFAYKLVRFSSCSHDVDLHSQGVQKAERLFTAEIRRSLIREMTLANIGLEHEVPPTRPAPPPFTISTLLPCAATSGNPRLVVLNFPALVLPSAVR